MSSFDTRSGPAILLRLLLLAALLLPLSACNPQTASAPETEELARVDLTNGPFHEVTLAQLSLAETGPISIHFSLNNLDTAAIDLSLQGDHQPRITILHAEQYRTNQDGGGDWRQTLPADRYRLVLSAEKSPGLLTIYADEACCTIERMPQP